MEEARLDLIGEGIIEGVSSGPLKPAGEYDSKHKEELR
jgi:hypothetical protein